MYSIFCCKLDVIRVIDGTLFNSEKVQLSEHHTSCVLIFLTLGATPFGPTTFYLLTLVQKTFSF
jgi:hypothetical protein